MDFQTFITKYSFINSKFVSDFYKIIKEDYIENFHEFLIDSEILRKWLQLNIRQDFNDTIKKRYKLGIDYKLETIKKSKGRGGHNFEVITLTPEVAKKICLSTNSKKGKDVQQYFIDLEFALYKYKNYIIDGMNQKINQLEHNMKPKINSDKKIIYIFRALNTNMDLYKIGKTINSKTRFVKHNSPLANDLEILFEYETENIDQVESCIKALLKQGQYRKYKEIYQVDLDIIKKSIKKCDASIIEINKKINQKGGIPLKDNDIVYLLFSSNQKSNNPKTLLKNHLKNNQKKTIFKLPKPKNTIKKVK
jgi:phage anti-repressor protein